MQEKLHMEFHSFIAEPFIEKADKIRNLFSQSEDEKQSQQSVQVNSSLNEKITYIRNTCPKKIENATHYQIKNINLLLLIFLHEDIKKICNETALPQNLKNMNAIKEDFSTLAFIGDRALELGILPSIWGAVKRDIPQKGYLNEQKKSFVNNKNLATIWDFLDFYDNKTIEKKKTESQHLSGSRMEAVFGIIYLESGLEAIEHAIKNLKHYYEKNRGDDIKS